MPDTNAVGKRSFDFSAMRRLNTSYLKSTMSQRRLNNRMVLQVHNDMTEKLDLIDIASDLIYNSQFRMNTFGKFLPNGLHLP